MRSGYSYFALQLPILTPKITVPVIVHQDPISKVIERCVLGAFEHRARESEDIRHNLFKLVSFASLPSARPISYNSKFFLKPIQKLCIRLNDTVLVYNKAKKNRKLDITQGLHLLCYRVGRLIHGREIVKPNVDSYSWA